MKIKHLWFYNETQWEVLLESQKLDNYKVFKALLNIHECLQPKATVCQEMDRRQGLGLQHQLYGVVRGLQAVNKHREHTGDSPSQDRERTSSLRGLPEVGGVQGNFW